MSQGRHCAVWLAGILVGLSSLLASSPALGVAVLSHDQNYEVQRRNNGQWLVGQAQPSTGLRVGTQSGFGNPGTNLGGINGIYFFKLPAVPAGEEVASVDFTVSLMNESSTGIRPLFNVDVYAAGFDTNAEPDNQNVVEGSGGVASTSLAQTYFFAGSNQVGATGGNGAPITKMQDNFFVPADWDAAVAATDNHVVRASSAAGNAALLSYVQSLYANPSFTAGDDFLILRLNPDADSYDTSTSQTQRYQTPYVQTATTNFPNMQLPTLNVTFQPVPEPATCALLGLGATGMLMRRRSRRA